MVRGKCCPQDLIKSMFLLGPRGFDNASAECTIFRKGKNSGIAPALTVAGKINQEGLVATDSHSI